MSKSGLELLNDLIAEIENAVSSSSSGNTDSSINGEKQSREKPSKPDGKSGSEKKQKKAPQQQAATTPVDNTITVNGIDLRVGVIRTVQKHETAEKLYCEEIDVGEEAPRAIASGLVPYYSLEEMQDRKLIVVCNLKPRNLVGFKSHGMVLCASSTLPDGTTKVEFVDPPANSKPGDRIVGEGLVGEPLTPSKCDKTKAFDLIAADLKVDAQGVAHWKAVKLVCMNGGGSCTTPTLKDALIK